MTLITTVRNGERFLEEALCSIQLQSFERWRLILVDDGSEDRTAELARAFAKTEPRCHLFIRPALGRLEALRFAHAQVDTEYVAWVDADDALRPDALSTCVEALDAASWAVMAFTQHEVVTQGGESREHRPRGRPTGLNLLRSFSTFHFRLIRSRAFIDAGGIGRYPIGIDYDLCLRLWELGPVLGLEEVLYDYRRHRAQMSSAKRSSQVEASASAVRDAIVRQGFQNRLRLRLEGKLPRFVLACPEFEGDAQIRGRVRQAVMRRNPAIGIRTAVLWPSGGSHLDTVVAEGLHRRGVVVVPVRPTLAGLEAVLRARRVPDLLVLHGLRRAVASMDASSTGRFLGVLARLRVEGCRVVWWDWEAGDTTPRVPRALRNPWLRRVEAVPPLAAGVVPFCDRRRARARLGLGDDDIVVVVCAHSRVAVRAALAELRECSAQARILVLGPASRETMPGVLHVREGPRSRRNSIAAADLVVFTHDWCVPGDPWCEATAAGRAVHVRGRLRGGLRELLGDAAPFLQGPLPRQVSIPLRAHWRAQGLRLRDALMQVHGPEALAAILIADKPRALARTVGRRLTM
ncbi:MAG: glycosyltransferase [Nannocystaceae bacterium]|nr:glycosyltransferase [Nannocystaceae bacterium]